MHAVAATSRDIIDLHFYYVLCEVMRPIEWTREAWAAKVKLAEEQKWTKNESIEWARVAHMELYSWFLF